MSLNKILLSTFIIFFFMTIFISGEVTASDSIGPLLFETLEAGHDLDIALVEMLHVRRHLLRVFLRKYLGNEFVDKNERYFPDWSDEAVISVRLTKLLKSSYPDKKKRNRIIATFRYPKDPSTQIQRFMDCLTRLLHQLRGPLPGSGYKYVKYSKSPGGKTGTQKLVARHTKDKPQQWHRTYEGKVYRIHMYSPSKRGIFGGNRDVWLDDLQVDYQVGSKKKKRSYPLKRFLKRGESIDIDLPEIADKVDVRLLFACKPEHRGKAEFFAELILAAQSDIIDSPHASLVSMIKYFSMKRTVKKTREELDILLKSLGTEMTGAMGKTVSSRNMNTRDKDQLQYFLYMLKDSSIKRKELIKRFSSMFGL